MLAAKSRTISASAEIKMIARVNAMEVLEPYQLALEYANVIIRQVQLKYAVQAVWHKNKK